MTTNSLNFRKFIKLEFNHDKHFEPYQKYKEEMKAPFDLIFS